MRTVCSYLLHRFRARFGALKHLVCDESVYSRCCTLQMAPLIFYRPRRSCGKVMFLHLSVILSTGEMCIPAWTVQGMCIPACSGHGGVYHRPPPRRTPSWADTPWAGTPRQTPPLPPRRPLQRMVRILLECILIL